MTEKKSPSVKEAAPGCAVLLVIALGIFIWFYFSSDEEAEAAAFNSLAARRAVEQCISTQLTSPGSAEFEPYNEKNYVQVNDTLWKFTGYVDSQNGFGALVRTNYRGSLIYYPERNTTRCVDVKFY